jgi:diguanylate cyclase (GGDEF)-like protein/PAS domain S-box-containing protein
VAGARHDSDDEEQPMPNARDPDRSSETDGLLRRLIDRLPAMLAYWDADKRNVVANEAYVSWFGFRPQDMVGLHIRDVLGQEVYAKNVAFMDAALRGEEQLFARTLVDTSGAVRHTQASYVPDIVDGDVAGFFVLVTDVTARVEAERALRRNVDQYRALARSLPDSFVLSFDSALRITFADGLALEAFGTTSEQLEGRGLYEALPTVADELAPRWRAALDGQKVRWHRTVGRSTYSLTAAGVTGADGVVFAGLVVGVDVTEDRRRAATDRGLQRIAATAVGGTSQAEIAEVVAATLLDLFQTDFAGVVAFEPGDAARILAMAPTMPVSLADAPFIFYNSGSATAQVAATGEPRLCEYGPPSDQTTSVGVLYESGIHIGAAAPIHVNGHLWGAISLGSADVDAIDGGTLAQLVDFAELVAVAISNREAWDTLAREAIADGLTGLPNRRAFDDYLARELTRAARLQLPLSLVLIDLDHFKQINDSSGHRAGDAVLVETAQRMTSLKREHEILARIGGEEFAWVLTDCDAEAAFTAAERLRLSIADSPYADNRTVTASLGVATTGKTLPDALTLIEHADQALYRSKRTGRNRTSTFDERPLD